MRKGSRLKLAEPMEEVTNPALNQASENEGGDSGRLMPSGTSADVIPRFYELKVAIPNDSITTFTCQETIGVTICQENISTVRLNGNGLKIASCSYEDCDKNSQPCCKWRYEGDEVLEVSFSKPLPAGDGAISIQFEGPITDGNNMVGLYRFQSQDEPSPDDANKTRYNFATHLEPAFARRVFFCWDEPGIKTTFRLKLVIPKEWVGLSNTANVDLGISSDDESSAVITFGETPIMSTYLLAFVVGSFDFVQARTPDDGVVCRVYAPPGNRDLGVFALGWALRSIAYFTNYFGTKCPLPKLDFVSVPGLAAGSSESWGLIVMKEDYLLIDEVASTFFTKQRSTLVLSHEISHQWLGNTVTMGFADLWFKESMATFLEYSCADSINPKSDLWLHFAVNICGKALPLDSTEGGSPISLQNGSRSQSGEDATDAGKFNALSYLKGACLLRMFDSFISAQTFRNGVRSFLTSHSYKVSSETDFWHAMEDVGFYDATEVMRPWTAQNGFPLIKIAAWRQVNETRILLLTQEKFCANPRFNEDKRELRGFQWSIPLEFITGREPKKVVKSVLMRDRMLEVSIPAPVKGDWVKIRSVGYFRVHYPPWLMRQFSTAISSKQMPPLDRIGLLDDLFHLCKCGEVTTIEVLQALKDYAGETNYYVWQDVCTVLKSLHLLLEFTCLLEKFNAFGVFLLKKVYQRLGFDATTREGCLEEELRTTILLRMIEFGDQGVIDEGVKRFEKCVNCKDFGAVPAYLRPVLYAAAVVSGQWELFRELLNIYEASTTQEEATQILRAFGYSKTEDSAKDLFDFISSQRAKPDAVSTLLYSWCSSRFGIERVWKFFRSNVSLFKNCRTTQTVVRRMIEGFCDNERAVQVEDFFREQGLEYLDEVVREGVENIRTREAWLARDATDLQEYLDRETTTLIIIDD